MFVENVIPRRRSATVGVARISKEINAEHLSFNCLESSFLLEQGFSIPIN